MKSLQIALTWLTALSISFATITSTSASGSVEGLRGRKEIPATLNEMLLQKAVRLEDYEANLIANGGKPFRKKMRKLEDENKEDDEDEDDDKGDDGNNYAGDDYFGNNMFSFNSYSLRFATCQKVQRFSPQAVENGEYSAMVTDDIVVLRLCPKRRCNANVEYGCSAGYGEYAMDLTDYLTIYMKYEYNKQQNLCNFCEACNAYNNRRKAREITRSIKTNRKLEDGADDADGEQEDDNQAVDDDVNQANEQDDGDDNAGDDNAGDDNANNNYAGDDDFYAYDGDDNADDYSYNDDYSQGSSSGSDASTCYSYSNLCSMNADTCSYSNDDDDGASSSSLGYLDYINYFGCAQLRSYDNNGYLWVNPYCDPYSNTISMGIFYDPYCSQYAGDDVDVNEFSGIQFDNDVLTTAANNQCIDCSASNSAPYFNSQNYLCNNVYANSGKCDTYLAYDLGNEVDDDAVQEELYKNTEVQCAFIESIRYGTYDNFGQIYVKDSQYSTTQASVVTKAQAVSLVALSMFCFGLALYSCYLHHEITNLLLKSLSIGLVDAKKRRTRSRSRNRRSRRKYESSEDDWDYESSAGRSKSNRR